MNSLSVWRDQDKRRAVLLSLIVHMTFLLLLAWWVVLPDPTPPETFIVIDLGVPVEAEQVVEAPAVEEPAPQAVRPQVEDVDTGEPQARFGPALAPSAPELNPRTVPAPPPQEIAQSAPLSQEVPLEQQETAPPPPPPPAPPPAVPEVSALTPSLPSVAMNSTVLPEINEVELEPRPVKQAIPVPLPTPQAEVPEARVITTTPSVQVAAAREVPQPSVSASVAAAREVPQPSVSASVAAAREVPQPSVSASVAAAREVPQPSVSASVAAAREVPQPSVSASVAAAREVPQPGVQAAVAVSRSVAIDPRVEVTSPQPAAEPQTRAEDIAPESEAAAEGSQEGTPEGTVASASDRRDNRTSGGNAPRSGQDRAQEGAAEGNLGAAAATDGSDSPSGVRLIEPRTPYREDRERPLAVLIDNVRGYPQSGLVEASEIIEMPVEGGLTRLLAIFDRVDPPRVGPVRSARPYFYELVQSLDGILVHDGGSPAALAAISRSQTPTLNAYYHGELFSRQEDRRAPYNLYAGGPSLRDAVNRLELERTSVVRGEIYQPAAEDQDVTNVRMRYSRTYTTGFAYQESLNLYRWLRNGEPAVDASGEAVLVDAVLLAKIDARPLPDDPEGRLYIPLRGGPATLYVRGKAITGEWHKQDGVQFVDANGEVVDLAPFKLWVVFTPNYDNRVSE